MCIMAICRSLCNIEALDEKGRQRKKVLINSKALTDQCWSHRTSYMHKKIKK